MRDDKPFDLRLGASNSQIAERGKSMIHFLRFAFATKRLAAIVVALTVGFACFAFAAGATPAGAVTNYWNGTCDKNNLSWASQLAASFDDGFVHLETCGPRPIAGGSTAAVPLPPNKTVTTTPGFQCVEFVERYLYLRYGLLPVIANGAQIVDNYNQAYPGYFQVVRNGTPFMAPAEDDVLSFADSRDFTGYGHTAVVQSSSVGTDGNGSINVIEENSSSTGQRTVPVSAWTVQYPGHSYAKWLHRPTWKGIALRHTGSGGYKMASDGTITPFGGALPLAGEQVPPRAHWPNQDIARGIVLTSDDQGGYMLDGFGGITNFGNAPYLAASAYWKGWDIARGIVLRSDNKGGYVLDGFGGVHEFGNAPHLAASDYWKGWDIAVSLTLTNDNGGWVMDAYGGLHTFGSTLGPPVAVDPHYWPGWRIAKQVVSVNFGLGGYILDGVGNVHSFGTAPAPKNWYRAGPDTYTAFAVQSAAGYLGVVGGAIVDKDGRVSDMFR